MVVQALRRAELLLARIADHLYFRDFQMSVLDPPETSGAFREE
jgi:hypothetical protein